MHDGTTPLVLAARLAIEGMVEILINADADINAADDHGKKLFLINSVKLYSKHTFRINHSLKS